MSVSRNLRFRFTLVSYNILSQTLLNDHCYLYNNCNARDLEWPRRGHKIVRELMNDQADIICLQEVESEHLHSLFRPRLARYGYECLYKKKTGYKVDGCAIFYKSRLFHLLNYKGIEFNRTDVAYVLNRDNVGIIAVLKPRLNTRSESSHLVIANTHLIFNPNRSDIKLAQLKFFLAELEAISSMPPRDSNSTFSPSHIGSTDNERQYHPTILCGDLNSTPNSEVSRYILKNTSPFPSLDPNDREQQQSAPLSHSDMTANGYGSPLRHQPPDTNGVTLDDPQDSPSSAKHTDSPCRPRIGSRSELRNFDHSLEFKSVYPVQNKAGQRYVSTFSSDIVDYIFYTPRLKLESFKELLTDEQLESIGSLPNVDFPSDHIPLGARFTMR